MALNAHIAKEKIPESAVTADEKSYLSGAEVYKQNCAVCHGLPDQPKTTIAQGMYPPPPQLFHGTGVTDDPASESYWKAENGIRLTGMPGFKGRLTEAQIWEVSVLLANADKIPASVKAALASPIVAQVAAPASAPAPANTPAPVKQNLSPQIGRYLFTSLLTNASLRVVQVWEGHAGRLGSEWTCSTFRSSGNATPKSR